MQQSGKPRVLIVDDEPQLRELLADALSNDDIQLEIASSGKEAIELANRQTPDLVITDLCLGDTTGLELIDRLRDISPDMPALVITGHGNPSVFSEASRRRPVEMFNKPLDLLRLKNTIQKELSRQVVTTRAKLRAKRLRKLARNVNIQRRGMHQQLNHTTEKLSGAYREMSLRLNLHKQVMEYQKELIEAGNDDEVFRSLFNLFLRHSGSVYGMAMVCDANAELQLVGRFGVPGPDNQQFCLKLAQPVINTVLSNPRCTLIDAGDQAEQFDQSIQKYLCGVSILAIPLVPADGQMIGLVILYRKGEQPFLEGDITMAEMLVRPTALAVQRNE